MRLITKQMKSKRKETKYNKLRLTSDPVFTGLEKLQRYLTGRILCKKKLWSISVDLLTPTDWILKGRTAIRVYFTYTIANRVYQEC